MGKVERANSPLHGRKAEEIYSNIHLEGIVPDFGIQGLTVI